MNASTEFLHGVRLFVSDQGYTPISVPSTAIIGLIATAPDADDEYFPCNQCILVTNIDEAIAKAGSSGTLAESLEDIKSEVTAVIVVVRVEEGATEAETTANIIGKINADDTRTGLQVMELAIQQTGVQPRLFGVPLYDKAKAVTLALFEHADKFYGFAYASASHCETEAAALLYRKEIMNACGMLYYGDPIVFNTKLAMETETYGVAKVLGLRARLDQELGWFHSISNYALKGVVGLTKEVTYSGVNGYGTGADTLNAAGISVFVQDEGYRTWGNRTCAPADSDGYFEVFTRSKQIVGLTLCNLMKSMLQDHPMSPVLLERFRMRANRLLADWTRAGRILGGEVILDPTKNSIDELMVGRPDWVVDFTPIPPIESPGLTVRITDQYVLNAQGGSQTQGGTL